MCDCKPDAPASDLELVRLHRPTARGYTTAGVDPCIAPLVQVLNDGGVQTAASCCGHNQRPGSIILADGRELLVMPSISAARALDHLWPDTFGKPLPRREG